MSEKPKKPRVDWEAVERDYRAGVLTLREIGERYDCSHVAITKRAKKEGWVRDLAPKIRERVALPPRDPLARAGFVYVIYIDAPGVRYYKIGMAGSFTARFDQHQCSSPFDICVACAYFVPDMRAEERALHLEFADKRVRGEWFALSADDVRSLAGRAVLI